jgi:hypothetical protein
LKLRALRVVLAHYIVGATFRIPDDEVGRRKAMIKERRGIEERKALQASGQQRGRAV